MAEIGIIASIIGVAGAGFRLSLILNAIGSEVASAGLEIHSISRGITLYSLMLKQVGQTLQHPDSVHSEEAKQAAHQITQESQLVFDEIQGMLDKVRTKGSNGTYSSTTIQRFKWCFKKNKVTYLLAQLESLKLSLSVMLQILQLGKLMASATKSDVAEAVAFKSEAIQQERVETQNVIIVRYWQMTRLDRLYDAAQHEAAEDRRAEIESSQNTLKSSGDAPLALEAPPAYINTLAKLPIYSLGEIDQSLHQIRESKKDMIEASDRVIDPLLDQWTRWQQVREYKEKRDSDGSGRYAASVQPLYENEEDRLRNIDFHNRENSPRGLYLEGPTTDWRQPHSVAAKEDASRRKKQFSNYQPSISVDSSDVEDEDSGKRPRDQIAHRHVVDSSSESSESEPEEKPRRRRKSSGSPTTEKKARFPEGPAMAHTYGPAQSTFGGRYTVSPVVTPGSTPRQLSGTVRNPFEQRPNPNPTQNPIHHSISSPIPPIHTSNAPNPYAAHAPYSPSGPPPPYPAPSGQTHPAPSGQTYPGPGGRYGPPTQGQRGPPLPPGPRPGSQDGKPRSPSRLSMHSSSSTARNRPLTAAETAAIKVKKDRTVYKSATKGLLGAGGIAMFLEALEGLDV